ncbi:type II toxin-antitoxin system prevent-host-death family antitoxin [Acidobacteria bacterium AH-259-G07]|nr:type II toxin-antitoxin system prevent-host-death family antitoxin [Acidobacteria bacterium AH-259-G07]
MASTVGVRELKNQLSRYLREVKRGRSITVTERGKVVALLVPANDGPDVRAVRELAKRGVGSWKGGKPTGAAHPPIIKGKSISQIVLEDRR